MKQFIAILLCITLFTNFNGIAKSRRYQDSIQRMPTTLSDSVYRVLLRMGVKYPEVAVAQARLETNNFKSRLFRKDNNLFGMKKRYVNGRRVRVRYVHYDSLEESCADYAAYYRRRIEQKISCREDYLKLLSHYSQTHNYVTLIRRIVHRSNYDTTTNLQTID